MAVDLTTTGFTDYCAINHTELCTGPRLISSLRHAIDHVMTHDVYRRPERLHRAVDPEMVEEVAGELGKAT